MTLEEGRLMKAVGIQVLVSLPSGKSIIGLEDYLRKIYYEGEEVSSLARHRRSLPSQHFK